MLICYDQWFPEAARSNALLGADVVFYPTAIGTWQGEAELKALEGKIKHATQTSS